MPRQDSRFLQTKRIGGQFLVKKCLLKIKYKMRKETNVKFKVGEQPALKYLEVMIDT